MKLTLFISLRGNLVEFCIYSSLANKLMNMFRTIF